MKTKPKGWRTWLALGLTSLAIERLGFTLLLLLHLPYGYFQRSFTLVYGKTPYRLALTGAPPI